MNDFTTNTWDKLKQLHESEIDNRLFEHVKFLMDGGRSYEFILPPPKAIKQLKGK